MAQTVGRVLALPIEAEFIIDMSEFEYSARAGLQRRSIVRRACQI